MIVLLNGLKNKFSLLYKSKPHFHLENVAFLFELGLFKPQCFFVDLK